MKKIYTAVVLLLSLQTMVYAAQESLQDVENGRKTMIDNAVTSFPYLTQGFDFLRTQHLEDRSFHDFLEHNMSHDEDGNEDINFDHVIIDAENIITNNMKNRFLQTLDTAIKEKKNLDEFDDLLFLYVMEHKDTTMYDMVRLWLYEWTNVKDENGRTPLHYAAIHNSIEIARMLIAEGADVNIQEDGNTPLYYAAMFNHIEIARMLIDAGADLNIQNNDGKTPLHWAAIQNSIEIARMLIDAGADLNIQNNDGRTAEQRAIIQEMTAIFAQAREKQQEKSDAQAMKRFEQLIKKDYR